MRSQKTFANIRDFAGEIHVAASVRSNGILSSALLACVRLLVTCRLIIISLEVLSDPGTRRLLF